MTDTADLVLPRASDDGGAPDNGRAPGASPDHEPDAGPEHRDEQAGSDDPRLGRPVWPDLAQWRQVDRKLGVLFPVCLVAALWYFEWLLRPERIGNRALYGLLIVAELFNLVQAFGFWWTCRHGRDRPAVRAATVPRHRVDILIPAYTEPLDIVRPTVEAALAVRGSTTVYLLDDAGRPELAALAAHLGARYVRRGDNRGAKAGNLNHALAQCDAPFVAVFDCDHVPDGRFLEATMGWFDDDAVGFVQTPQYYANARRGAWRRRRGPSRRSSSGASPGARTGSGPCSAAAPTSCSAVEPWTMPAASPRARSPRTSSCRSACMSSGGARPT